MLRYGKRPSRLSVARAWLIPVVAVLCLAGFFYAERSFQRQKSTTWLSVTAKAEDARLRPLARFALEYGSKDLYVVEVLADYSVNGAAQKTWVAFSESALPLTQAKAEAASLRGKQLVVRWDPAVPNQKLAELP